MHDSSVAALRALEAYPGEHDAQPMRVWPGSVLVEPAGQDLQAAAALVWAESEPYQPGAHGLHAPRLDVGP